MDIEEADEINKLYEKIKINEEKQDILLKNIRTGTITIEPNFGVSGGTIYLSKNEVAVLIRYYKKEVEDAKYQIEEL